MLDETRSQKAEYDAAIKEPIVASYHGAKFEFRADYVTENGSSRNGKTFW